MTATTTAIGIDIGGTGIKGAVVDLDTGELVSDRVKLPTPEGGKPDDIVETTKEVLGHLESIAKDVPVGE
jgi:polyphosphate glucokinase